MTSRTTINPLRFGALSTLFLALAASSCSNKSSTESDGDESTIDAGDSHITDVKTTTDDDTSDDDSVDAGDSTDEASSTDELSTDGFIEEEEPVDKPDAGDDEAACGTSPYGAARVPANVLVVLDKSGSMTEVPDGFGSDKWSSLKQSLSDALQSVEDEVSFGLHLFPYPDGCAMPSDGALTVEVGAGPKAVPNILQALDDVEPGGGTPTASALGQAFAYFTDGAGKDLEGRKYVLLATDGGPICNEARSCGADQCVVNLEGRCHESFSNCCDPDEVGDEGAGRNCLDDDETLMQVEALHAAGIETFVVGVPGSESFADSLNAFAIAGGRPVEGSTASYFVVDDVDVLSDVLHSITRELLTSCELRLESIPPDLDQLNVEVEGELIAQDGPDGWDLDTETDPPTVVLKGATCERIETEGVEAIRVVYGCPTFRVK